MLTRMPSGIGGSLCIMSQAQDYGLIDIQAIRVNSAN